MVYLHCGMLWHFGIPCHRLPVMTKDGMARVHAYSELYGKKNVWDHPVNIKMTALIALHDGCYV